MHCTEFYGVCSWQNGIRCRDGVKLLWCHCYLVCLVLGGGGSMSTGIPTCACFHSENFAVTCFCFVFSRNDKKERREVGGEAEGKVYGL